MLIREWVAADNKRIAVLEKQCFAYPWNEDMVGDAQSMDNFIGLVLCDEKEVVQGYVGAINAGYDADIALVAVSPDYRRRGFALHLMEKMLETLKDCGVQSVFLEVRKNNDAAKALYAKCGFVAVGERRAYYEDGTDAIVMLKEINVGI